jgi:hypothetical protein
MRIDDEVLQSLRSSGPRARPRSRFSRREPPADSTTMLDRVRLGLRSGTVDVLENSLSRPTPTEERQR